MKKAALLASILVALTLTTPSLAQTSTPSATPRKTEKLELKKDTLAQQKERITQRLANLKERIASKTATLRERLANFKDKQKVKRVENINDLLNKINERRTTAMGNHLNKMDEILTKLETRIANASVSGKVASRSATASTSAQVTLALNNAQTAIDKAKTAVQTQADKDYTVNVSSESAARADAKKARDSLHTDLKTVHQLVVDARQSLSNAIKIIASNLGGLKLGQ